MSGRIESIGPAALIEQLDRHVDVALWLTDPAFEAHLHVSDAVEDLFGLAVAEVEADPTAFMDGIHPDDRASVRSAIDAAADGEVGSLEVRVDPAAGYARRVSTQVVPLTDHTDTVVAVGGVLREVTGRHERRRRLRDYERAIEGANDLIVAVDRGERYLFANEAYCAYLGRAPEDIIGDTLASVLDAQTYRRIRPHVERAQEGETVSYRMTRHHAELGQRIYDVQYYPLGDHGAITGAVGALRDVTGREERTQHLRVLNRVLRHNLRNDLTVVSGLAADEEVDEIVDELLETTTKGQRITEILTEQPGTYAIDLGQTLDDVIERSRRRFQAATISDVEVDDVRVLAIAAVSDALDELVQNAVVHGGDHPSVEVAADVDGEDALVRVTDDGPGIPAAERAILESGDPPRPMSHGNGLGLWLVYWIARRSDGAVTVEDSDCGGSVVSLRLPRADGGNGY